MSTTTSHDAWLRRTIVLVGTLIPSLGLTQVNFGFKAGANGTLFSQDFDPAIVYGISLGEIRGSMNEAIPGTGLPQESGTKLDVGNAKGWGYLVGAFLDAQASESVHLRLEMLYSLRSAQGDYVTGSNVELSSSESYTIRQATNETGTFRQDLGYLEVPLLLSFHLEDVRLQAGFGSAFLLGGRTTRRGEMGSITWQEYHDDGYTFAQIQAESDEDIDVSLSGAEATRGLNSLEWAGIAGVEVELSETLLLGLRYWHGLSSVHVNTPEGDGSTHSSHHQVVQLTFGIGLPSANKQPVTAP